MNLFSKSKTFLAATLAAASPLMGQNSSCAVPKKPVEAVVQKPAMMPSYSAPARIDVRGAWDFYAVGSFTYWQAMQDNMELGVIIDGSVTPARLTLVNNNNDFHPGFKVSLGMSFDHDSWDSCVNYTWFRGSQHNATNLDPATLATTYMIINWPQMDTSGSFNYAYQQWRLHMDLLDWELARSYYVGTHLTFRPFLAARAAWIRQGFLIAGLNNSQPSYASLNDKFNSWGVGPRVGLYADWIFGKGFGLYGNAMADILFTQYTTLSALLTVNGTSVTYQIQKDLNCLRPHIEGEMGFTWGSYFDNNNWHIDLALGYGFQVFFDQNMVRKTVNAGVTSSSFTNIGNLYMHGLTFSARLDF